MGEELKSYIMIYVDNNMCMSNTFEQRLIHLESILTKFQTNDKTIKFDKSLFVLARNKFHLDYSITLNPNLNGPQYLLPRLGEMFAQLSGGKHFTVLDIQNAFSHMNVTQATSKLVIYTTIRDCINATD